ncbi:LysR family transcriptional regulator, partial [Methylibium sp. T29]|uniref:LysR family transcriptional regulator n=1 Tax=Methylibium sp. T29 TaxID=1430884 RepID=UPI001C1E3E80
MSMPAWSRRGLGASIAHRRSYPSATAKDDDAPVPPLARPRGAAGFRIDPFDLRLFGAVAEAGSITAGAREMHLSLSAASTRLQNLEHALGAALLVRSKQGVVPTDAGRTLRRHAGRLQRDMEALHAEMSAHAHGVRSSVRVLCNTAAMTEYLPALLGRFLVAHPDIDVDLRELGSPDVLRTMRQEHADIGIVADYVDTEGLNTRVFREDRLVVLQPAQGSRAGRRALRFADVIDQPSSACPPRAGSADSCRLRRCARGVGCTTACGCAAWTRWPRWWPTAPASP